MFFFVVFFFFVVVFLYLVCRRSKEKEENTHILYLVINSAFIGTPGSRSLMAMSLDVPLMVHICLNLFALPEHLGMLLTSVIVTKSKLPKVIEKQ